MVITSYDVSGGRGEARPLRATEENKKMKKPLSEAELEAVNKAGMRGYSTCAYTNRQITPGGPWIYDTETDLFFESAKYREDWLRGKQFPLEQHNKETKGRGDDAYVHYEWDPPLGKRKTKKSKSAA